MQTLDHKGDSGMRSKIAFLFSLFLLASPVFAEEFIPGVAVNDAAKMSDKDKQQFYVTVVPADSDMGSTIAVLTKKFIATAKAKANMGVIGPDPDLTARILLVALQVAANDSLKGATILYVGDTKYADELQTAALGSGAVIRTTKYSGK